MRIRITTLLALIIYCGVSFMTEAQRIQQTLGRGVTVVANGSTVAVTWRKFAQEPEDILYNIYVRNVGGTDYTLLNETPLSKTNFTTTTSKLPVNREVAVATVINGVEQAKSEPFVYTSQFMNNVFMDIKFGTFLDYTQYDTKFVWPADLTGDGEFDYVVDRRGINGATDKVEAYTRFGEHLWTVDMGPNVRISTGHDDMVIAYDMDCDGKAEVVIKSSDGTRFWDKANNTYGQYLKNAVDGDTDGDGIVDYTQQSRKNPPQYITVIDGLTGAEKSTIEMTYPSYSGNTYTRTNKADYMNEEYSKLNGHMAIAYFDGVHPSVVMEYMVRDVNKTHHYYVSAWGYEFVNGKAMSWKETFPTWSRNDKSPWPAEFHHIRVADVDFDGKDEMLDGGFAVNNDGTMLFSAGISHGDRFRTADIDPDRPGLETFAIQQNAPDMLGMILYDAGTGEAIKKWYLASVGDVGRGECIDVDPKHKGLEMWSTMGNLYNAKGELISTDEVPFPREGMWWDGDLDREYLGAPDGNGYNAYIADYYKGRLFQMASESNWAVKAEYGTRPMFFGDIIGDWREEVVLRKFNSSGCTGIVGYSTNYSSAHSLYCLMENPAYRMQTTTRGYYQSAYTDYYLGYDMPAPPLPSVMTSDIIWNKGSEWNSSSANFTDFTRSESMAFKDGNSVIFYLTNSKQNNIDLTGTLKPSVVYVMAPRGTDYTWNGTGALAGDMDLWKSMCGSLTINTPVNYTGKTYVSEGTLVVNTTIPGDIDLRARGTIAGNGTFNGNISFEGALNYEGCRLSPGTDADRFGTLVFGKDLTIPGEVYMEMDLQTVGEVLSDVIKVNGNFSIEGNNYFTIVCNDAKMLPGEYSLIEWTGDFTGDVSNITIKGMTGLSYKLQVNDKKLSLVINDQRSAMTGVLWKGSENNNWDYESENFELNNEYTTFVGGDEVIFDDTAEKYSINMDQLMEVSSANFITQAGTYSISGSGGFTGKSSVVKNGAGKLELLTKNSDYTGATILRGGNVTINELAEAGNPSCIGAASDNVSNLILDNMTLTINNANTATNRGMTIEGETTIGIPSGFATLKGIIAGSGQLIKSGSGQLNITYAGNNTYTGGSVVKGGTLAMGAFNTTFGKLGSSIELQGGKVKIFDNNNTSAVPNFKYNVSVLKGTTSTIELGSRCVVDGTVTGEGTLYLTFPYVRGEIKSDFSGFSGTLRASGNQFRLCQATDFSNASVVLSDGLYMGHYSQGSGNALNATSKLGSLASTGTPTVVNGTYNIGYNNKNTTFTGVLSGVTVNKYGTGTWTLTGENSATLNIYEGRVNANAENTNTTTITVKSGGTLGGSGSVKGVTVESGGKIVVGTSAAIGAFTLNGNLTVSSGTIAIKSNAIKTDALTVNGTVRMTNAIIEMSNTSSYSTDKEYQVLTANRISGTYTISPEYPAEGLEWDDSKLLSDGILGVKVAAGIRAVGDNGIMIYPALVKEELYVDATDVYTGTLYISVFDVNGKTVLNNSFEASEVQTIDMTGLSAGNYIVRITDGKDSKTQTITKQ